MNIESAAMKLEEKMENNPFFIMIGIGKCDNIDTIFLYVENPEIQELKKIRAWMGFLVAVEKMGIPKALI